jgi:hypothetical protein
MNDIAHPVEIRQNCLHGRSFGRLTGRLPELLIGIHHLDQLIAADIISLVTVGALLVSSGYLIRHAARFPQVIPALHFQYYYMFWIMAIGFALIFLSRSRVLIKRLMGMGTAARNPEGGELP